MVSSSMSAILISLVLAGGIFASDAELEKARDRQDRAALEKIAGNLAAAAKAAPKDADAQFRAALAASFQAEVAIELKDKVGAKNAADAGITFAEKAIDLQPKNAENYRVLATLCGQVVPANPFAGLSYGKRAKDAITRALELNPKSPEVHLAEGVGNYYLPAALGGGPELAAKNFNEAIALDPKSADAYLWLGLTLRKLHKNPEARQAFAKSVELNPHRIWAKDQLDKTPPQ
jgi:tetratricopeptide (TPR) repeat protein